MTRRILILVVAFARTAATLADEDIHFLAEHAVESGMDAVYMALPWPAGNLDEDASQASVDLAAARTTTEFMRLDGTAVAVSAARSVTARWGYEVLGSYGRFSFSGGDGRVRLSSRFLGAVPLDLPQFAALSAVHGTQAQLSLGAAVVHEREEGDSVYSSQLIAGLLLERVEVARFGMDYRLMGGVDVGAAGTLEYDSRAAFVTPFMAWQQTRNLAPRWTWSPRAMLVVPLPPRALDARITAPQVDLATPPAGPAIRIGDGFVVLGLAFRHRPSGLEIDIGGRPYFAAAESASHHGVDGARILHIAWRRATR